jgi:surface protein
MFRYCRVLKGGSGTLAGGSSALLNVSYAHIDGVPTNPGYLTAYVNSLYAVLSGGTLTLYNDMYRNAREGRVFDLNTENNAPEWSYWTADISQVAFDAIFATAKPTPTFGWFEDCTGLTAIDLSMLNTSEVTNMTYLFFSCSQLETLDLSHFDTSRTTDMSYMFAGCSALKAATPSIKKTKNQDDEDICRGHELCRTQ